MKVMLLIFFGIIALGICFYYWWLGLLVLAAAIAIALYCILYFKSEKFLAMKSRIQTYIDDCNALNQHIEDLKETALPDNRTDTGDASYTDTSKWNVKGNVGSGKFTPHVHECSSAVCDGARKNPFKYVCKYFGIPATEESLSQVETVLNNFEAAEDGKKALSAEHDAILASIQGDVPKLIWLLCKQKLDKELGFDPVNLKSVYFPRYIFKYTSAGGNTSKQCEVEFNIDELNRFVAYLADTVKFRKSVAGQRALMTSALRNKIKERDHFTCCQCGVSTQDEPHLLLEIDHIVPVSKGGLTSEDNLQTLCWKCNRSKGAKTA